MHTTANPLQELPFPLVQFDRAEIIFINRRAAEMETLKIGSASFPQPACWQELIRLHENSREPVLAVHNKKTYQFNFENGFLSGTDVTSLSDRNHFYEDLLDHVPADIGAFSADDFHYLYVNAIGIKDPVLRKWIIGKTDKDYCVYRGRAPIMAEERASVYRAILENKEEVEFEEQITLPDGQKKYQLRRLVPVFDEKQQVRYIIGYGINITDRIVAEQKAAASARAKEQFLANMSHEIRTPLNAIMAFGRQLEKGKLSGEQVKFVDAINTASTNLLVIVNDILDLSKIEAGMMAVERRAFSFEEILTNLRNLVSYKAEEKGIGLSFVIEPSVHNAFIFDAVRIEQVLTNIVSNAIKFTHRGEVSLNISNNISQRHTGVLLTIKDSGVGMTAEFLDKIFDSFTQEKSNSFAYGGTGLGMSIAKRLVDMMEGTIHISSEPGAGTCVEIYLPLEKTSLSLALNNQPADTDFHFLKGKTILAVDDNELNRFVVSALLEPLEVKVLMAVNGEEAIMQLEQNNRIDLVLMDLQMPVLDGYQATRIIREKFSKTIPVIGLSANVIKGEKEKCLQSGMNGFIGKPLNETAFFELLRECLPGTGNTAQSSFDLTSLHQLNSDAAFQEKFLSIAKALIAETIQQLKQELSETVLAEVVHKIKPGLEMLNANSCSSLVSAIESALKNEAPAEEIVPLRIKLLDALQVLDNELAGN